jgi:hypothetical protein
MDSLAGLSQSQITLLAADRLEGLGFTPFTESMLVVETWKMNRSLFGLRGFLQEYPDNNRIRALLVGERGLIKKLMFVKEGKLLYSLSESGKSEVARIKVGDKSLRTDGVAFSRQQIRKPSLTRNETMVIQWLSVSPAYVRFISGAKAMIALPEAAKFWEMEPPDVTGDIIVKAEKMMDGQEGLHLFGDDEYVSKEKLLKIKACHTYLLNTFGGRINATQRA